MAPFGRRFYKKEARPPSFRRKRCGVEKSPLMVRAALRWEISRLRVSSMRFPPAPYRHASPLEMTILASAPLVISTEAKRSGEISCLNGQKRGAAFAAGCVEGLWKKVLKMDRPLAGGFLSLTALQAEGCGSALRARIIKKGHALRHFDRSEAEWRNLSL